MAAARPGPQPARLHRAEASTQACCSGCNGPKPPALHQAMTAHLRSPLLSVLSCGWHRLHLAIRQLGDPVRKGLACGQVGGGTCKLLGLGACTGGGMGRVAWCSSQQVLSRHRLSAFATVVGRCCAPAAQATTSQLRRGRRHPSPSSRSPPPPRTGLEHAVLLAGMGDQGRPARVGLKRVNMAHHNQGGASPGCKVGEQSSVQRQGQEPAGEVCSAPIKSRAAAPKGGADRWAAGL